ncbi:Transcription elongation factor S-II, central region domain containing protein [Dorcoceras hygrometricum]|uniref:Transcription elongation factor S-II, central region domain containing protein n=1 Tax=Dorcoceras hygrometricum TaxID=472368 RepID=A0A2Z7AKH7_9LAMI|nr:Transcription elongation factor S-II, central region domain containing protein [Dorcoceras hygrometricum]
MSFVKADMMYNCLESVKYDNQNSPKLNENGKAGIGFSKPERFKPNWLKNRLDKDKAKASQKPFVPNQSWHNSKKVKSGWKKFQQRRDQYDQSMKPKLKRPARDFAHTFVNPRSGKTVRIVQIWVPKGQLNGLSISADRFIKSNQQMLLSRSADTDLCFSVFLLRIGERQRFDKLERRRGVHCFSSAEEDFSRLFVEEVQQIV